jgi:hypothetical protein
MRTLTSLACLAALGGCAIIVAPGDGEGNLHFRSAFSDDAGTVQGNGVSARDQRAVPALQGLEVSGSMTVDVRVGPAPSLLVEADSNLLPLIHTEPRGDSLHVYAERSINSRNPVHIIYTVPRLTRLESNGSGRVAVAGLDGAPLTVRKSGSGTAEIAGRVASLDATASGSGSVDARGLESASADLRLSGSGHMVVGQVRGDYARVEVSGSGDLQASGAVRSLTVRVNGSGGAHLDALAAQEADIESNGSGGVSATVHQSVRGRANGSGAIRVHGHPAQSSVSGNYIQI